MGEVFPLRRATKHRVFAPDRAVVGTSSAHAAPHANAEEEEMPATMTSPEELFVHELEDVYYAEKTLTKVLPTLVQEVSDQEFSDALQKHLDETKEQVANLEQVFKELGMPAKGEKCPGIDGIKEEHDTFLEENDPSDELLDLFVTGAAARTEHYEIAAYTGLVGMAESMGAKKAAELLQENLKQEEAALRKVETISKRLLKDTAKATR
jgi:ferritin-like metal-binding protein YciE